MSTGQRQFGTNFGTAPLETAAPHPSPRTTTSEAGVPDRIVFRSLPDGARWKVTRYGKVVAYYPFQTSAQNAVSKLARSEIRRGNAVLAVLHKSDGSFKMERHYSKAQVLPRQK